MIPYVKDSALLIVRTTENGYTIELAQWDVSPPPVQLAPDSEPPSTDRRMYNADDKTQLKALFAAWVDNLFDQ